MPRVREKPLKDEEILKYLQHLDENSSDSEDDFLGFESSDDELFQSPPTKKRCTRNDNDQIIRNTDGDNQQNETESIIQNDVGFTWFSGTMEINEINEDLPLYTSTPNSSPVQSPALPMQSAASPTHPLFSPTRSPLLVQRPRGRPRILPIQTTIPTLTIPASTILAPPKRKEEERKWFVVPQNRRKMRLKHFPSNHKTSEPNLNEIPADASTPLDFYSLFLTDELLESFVKQINLYAQQCIIRRMTDETLTENSRLAEWYGVTLDELKVFIGIILWMGLNPRPTVETYWSRSIIYRSAIGQYMTRNRFELLLAHFHFSDNETANSNDRLCKLGNVISYLNEQFVKMCTPGANICIDETMMPWRGRLVFRQFIPNKRQKYGVKLYKLCLPHGYTHRFKIYTGKKDIPDDTLSSETVVMQLCESVLDSGRALYTDNYYTSLRLADKLLSRKTHLIGTLRSNRKFNPKEVTKKDLRKGEMICRVSNGVSVCKWRDKRDVLFLTTKHRPDFVEIRNKRGQVSVKHKAIVEYNIAKTFIDVSDQAKTYGTATRRGLKWYHKVAIELLCNTSVVNAHILFMQCTGKKLSITEYRERLAQELLCYKISSFDSSCSSRSSRSRSSTPFDDLPLSSSKHKLVFDVKKRGRCVPCYQKISKSSGRQVAVKLANIHSWCDGCNEKFMCITYFNASHICKLK